MTGSAISSRSTLFALSDSTGNLARQMLAAVLAQFPPDSIAVRFECFVRTEAQIRALLQEAIEQKATVCYAMMSEPLKEQVEKICASVRLHCLDLTGGLVQFLEANTGITQDLEVFREI